MQEIKIKLAAPRWIAPYRASHGLKLLRCQSRQQLESGSLYGSSSNICWHAQIQQIEIH
jgi:hypothetical protein